MIVNISSFIILGFMISGLLDDVFFIQLILLSHKFSQFLIKPWIISDFSFIW